MKGSVIAALLTLSISLPGSLRAQDAPSSSEYLTQLQLKLDHAARRANQPTTAGSSVVGLRGSKSEPLSKQLYWKGKGKPAPVSVAEIQQVRAAVEKARAGLTREAIGDLQKFQSQFPHSALKSDVDETLKRLAETAPAAPAESAPASPAAQS